MIERSSVNRKTALLCTFFGLLLLLLLLGGGVEVEEGGVWRESTTGEAILGIWIFSRTGLEHSFSVM